MGDLQYRLALIAVYALIGFLMLWAVAANAGTVCYANGQAVVGVMTKGGFVAQAQFVDEAGTAWRYWHRTGASAYGKVTSHNPKTGMACIEAGLPSKAHIFREV